MSQKNDQDQPLISGRTAEGTFTSSPDRQQARRRATRFAYNELARLNARQEKVTEEELRSRATTAAMTAAVVDLSEPEENMKLFLETYMRILREGGAVVSLLELVAIRSAQREKRKDAVRATAMEVSDVTLLAKARAEALVYVIGDAVMRENLQSAKPLSPALTPEQQKQCDLYADTYVKYYQLYKIPRKKFLGLF